MSTVRQSMPHLALRAPASKLATGWCYADFWHRLFVWQADFCAAVGWGSEFVGWKFRYRLQACRRIPAVAHDDIHWHYQKRAGRLKQWCIICISSPRCRADHFPRPRGRVSFPPFLVRSDMKSPLPLLSISTWDCQDPVRQLMVGEVEVWPNRWRFDPRFLWYVFNICAIHPGTIESTIVPWSRRTVFHLIIQYFMNWHMGSQDSIWH